MRREAVADLVHDDRFWILTDLNMVTALANKHDSIMQYRNPAPPTVPAHRRPRQSHQGRSPGIQAKTPHFTAQNPDFHCQGPLGNYPSVTPLYLVISALCSEPDVPEPIRIFT